MNADRPKAASARSGVAQATSLRQKQDHQSGSRAHRARARLIQAVTGCWTTQALRVAVDLGLADQLAKGPRAVGELAVDQDLSVDGLTRLLRALSALDVSRELPDGRFGLGSAGEALRLTPGDQGPSLQALVRWWSGPMWSLWAELGYSVRTGCSAREQLTGRAAYGFLEARPELATDFHQAMQAMTAMIADDLAGLPFWPHVRSLVDVGGGNGSLVAALLQAHAGLLATVLDRVDAQEAAVGLFEALQLSDRAKFAVGDFFANVPKGGDVYVLKSILHNWDDPACAQILSRCAQAASPGARLLLIERVRPIRLRYRVSDLALARTDLNMLAGLGGRERSLAEFQQLLDAAGFAVHAQWPTAFEFSVIEARRVA